MYVTDFNNDVARIAVREKGAKGWREDAIMAFERATATDVWAGRIAPSRHNTSLARHGVQRILERQRGGAASQEVSLLLTNANESSRQQPEACRAGRTGP